MFNNRTEDGDKEEIHKATEFNRDATSNYQISFFASQSKSTQQFSSLNVTHQARSSGCSGSSVCRHNNCLTHCPGQRRSLYITSSSNLSCWLLHVIVVGKCRDNLIPVALFSCSGSSMDDGCNRPSMSPLEDKKIKLGIIIASD